MLLIRIALPVFLAYLFTALSTGAFLIFIATEYDSSKFLELIIFSVMGVLDLFGVLYLLIKRKKILGIYMLSEDELSLDVEKGYKQKSMGLMKKEKFGFHVEINVEEPRPSSDRVMDLY